MTRVPGYLYIIIGLAQAMLLYIGPLRLPATGTGDAPFFVLIGLHLIAGAYYIVRAGEPSAAQILRDTRVPDILLSLTLVLFLFSYIFALNANMDYVQRFIATGGDLRLAPDTTAERQISFVRYTPIICANVFSFAWVRVVNRRALRRIWPTFFAVRMAALPLTLVSAAAVALAFPSFISLAGLPFLAFAALVPLFLVLKKETYGWAVFYGVCYGVFANMTINYWLGPYSLISLQFSVVVFALLYFVFMATSMWLYRRIKIGGFLVLPMAWVLFDYLRSTGFLGYPWGILGTTQHGFLPLIQMAAVTGVWGVNFVVLLVGAALAEALCKPRRPAGLTRLAPIYTAFGLLLVCVVAGGIYLLIDDSRGRNTLHSEVRVALIQQNSDPRKHEYEQTLDKLRMLTDQALAAQPDLIAWSETAFVPNIRRWSREDPDRYELARLTEQFLSYQKSTRSWLITGNDDYERVVDASGAETRVDFNAAVLFSPDGERVGTYRKMHLVPFTEYFPYKEQLPWVYEMLMNFDVSLWEPGRERKVFQHPLFRFATPICFEDAFPDDVRRFVAAGAEAILVLSNDYWSLAEVEAKQHYIAAMFRAVENRVPLIRSTASGLTSHVDHTGRLRQRLPYYEEGYLVADLKLRPGALTFYSRFGDWFPGLMFVGLLVLAVFSIVGRRG